MNSDPGHLPFHIWVRDCTKQIMQLDPLLRTREATELAATYWRARRLRPRAESPESVAERMLAPPAGPLRWLE